MKKKSHEYTAKWKSQGEIDIQLFSQREKDKDKKNKREQSGKNVVSQRSNGIVTYFTVY